ncbi:hypothetical protein L9F63_009051, partial [Diploptera punctata]
LKVLGGFWSVKITMAMMINTFLAIYLLGTWNQDHFSKRNITSLKAVPFFGNMAPIAFRRLSLPDFILDIYNRLKGHKYGGIYEFMKPIILLRDPELIKMVTVKDFEYFLDHRSLFTEDIEPLFGRGLAALQGQEWKHMRSTLSPAFTSSKMKYMFVLVSECGVQLGDFLHQCINDKTMKIQDCKIERVGNKIEVEMKDLFTRYTNDVITTTALGIGCDSLKNPQNEFYSLGKKLTSMGGIQQLIFLGYLLSPKLMKMLNVKFMSDKMSNFFRSLILDTMNIRENKGIIRPDMIHLLMQARKGTLQNEENDVANGTSIKPKWEDDDIIAQALLFFFAGFETVSILMCFASHLLAVHSDVQTRLQQEIDQTMQESNGKITYEAVHSMKYLDMVLSETLRIYPPAGLTDRKRVKTYTLPTEPPYTLHPGEGLWIPVYALHHDPEYFPDPDKFDPERFSDENKDKIKPFTYLPFGSGPRNCIGNRFALMETKIALVHILSRFNFQVVSRTPIPIQITKKGQVRNTYGGIYEFMKPVVVLRDPELIKMVTVKDFEHFLDHRTVLTDNMEPLFSKGLINLQGHKWKQMRSTLGPAFTSSKMKNMFVLVSECAVQLGDFLHRKPDGNKLEVEMKDLFTRYTNDVIATSALGIGCDSLKNPRNEFYTLGKNINNYDGIQQLKLMGFLINPNLMKIFNIKLLNAMKIRESKSIIRPDMIHLLMQAKKGTLQCEENDTPKEISNKMIPNHKFTVRE